MDAIVIVFIVFMSFVSLICVFALLIVLRDLIQSGKKNEDKNPSSETPKDASAPAPKVEEPVESPMPILTESETVSETPTEPTATEETAVTFAPSDRKTLSEMYEELPKVYRTFYDDIAKHAEQCEGVTRHIKNDNYEEWKIGSARLIRLKIKKGIIISEFNLMNSEMKEHIQESKVDVKQSSTSVKLEDYNAVLFAIESMDLVVKVLKEERERKKQERATKRREKRKNESK